MIDVSIVIISWKMRELLRSCLSSVIRATQGISFEIIVIDNNSEDGTSEMIQSFFPSAKLIINSQNKGVAPARNQGLEYASGKYVLILDADMEFTENSIMHLYNFMELNPDTGMAGCKLLDKDGNLQYSCKRFPSFVALMFRRLEGFRIIKNSNILKNHTMAEWDHNSVRDVDYLIGACQFIRRNVLKLTGFYDANIFYGPEDIDMCIRIWKQGYKVKYFPFTSIIHHEQRITKKNLFSQISIKHLKGIIYLFLKYRGRIKPF